MNNLNKSKKIVYPPFPEHKGGAILYKDNDLKQLTKYYELCYILLINLLSRY